MACAVRGPAQPSPRTLEAESARPGQRAAWRGTGGICCLWTLWCLVFCRAGFVETLQNKEASRSSVAAYKLDIRQMMREDYRKQEFNMNHPQISILKNKQSALP